ncbi:MAG: SDR family NAD(P)-dependent oxidoreductase [Chloroflexi bacterium]|nr:SDR family NAD(P)-dependent oxidoreductase [Chloroflexota bacterium]
MNEKKFSGKVVLITGAGRGAGRMLAQAFAAQGAQVAANDISPVNLEPVVQEINAAGGHARAYIHDIAKKVDVQVMINNVSDDFGHIDILVNSANVLLPSTLLEIDEWDLHRVFEVNAIGTLLMMQSAGRVMRAQGSGIMINVVKLPGVAPASFIASRAGLIAMTERLNAELGVYGIRVFAMTEENPVEAVLAACLV